MNIGGNSLSRVDVLDLTAPFNYAMTMVRTAVTLFWDVPCSLFLLACPT